VPDDRNDTLEGGRLSFFLQQQLVGMAKKAFLQLATLFKNATLYPSAHPFFLGSAEQLLVALEELLSKRNEASFHIIAGELFFETLSVPVEESLSLLLEDISRKGVGGITFRPGLKRDELVAFASLMRRDPGALEAQGGAAALVIKAGIIHVLIHKALPVNAAQDDQKDRSQKKASETYLDGIETVRDIVSSAHTGRGINTRRMQTLVHTMVDSVLENRDALVGLTSIKLYDEYTFAHSVNVAILSIAMGTFLSLEKSQIATLGTAGMLHDIGKVKIPLEIINKPDSLTDAEWDIMKRHPLEGAMILSGLGGVSKLAMVTAFEHHQHYDYRGYPERGGSDGQHPFSKIVALADTYDALTAVRVYYSIQKPPDEAIRILLKKRGSVFDPVLVKAFVNMVGIFPIGTLLRLDTGEIGLVVHQTRDLMRPRVLLLKQLDGTEKEEVSLLEMEQGRYRRTPLATVDPNALGVNVNQYLV